MRNYWSLEKLANFVNHECDVRSGHGKVLEISYGASIYRQLVKWITIVMVKLVAWAHQSWTRLRVLHFGFDLQLAKIHLLR